MIEFLTLFLGIAAGPQQVELSVDERVAAVELRLDGELLATAESGPWRFPVNLGTRILPHRLEAIALNEKGEEVDRSSQVLNVPRAAVEVGLALERENGRLTGAKIAWESSISRRPDRMRAQLDGVDIPILAGDRVDLRDIDESLPHVLQVTLGFLGRADAQGLALLGGDYVGETSAALTAWPILVRRGNPQSHEMTGWFLKGEAPLRPVAVEKGSMSLVIVRSPQVAGRIRRLSGRPEAAPLGGSSGIGFVGDRAVATSGEVQRNSLPFDNDTVARLLVPRTRKGAGQQVDYDLFTISPELTQHDGGLYWALTQEVLIAGLAGSVRVSDAVTSAGLQSAATNDRRAVLLVLGEEWEDTSRFDPQAARQYLEALGVPLFVWRVGEEPAIGPEWGDGPTIRNYTDLKQAWRALEKSVGRQRVVWLEGSHLPNSIRLSSTARAAPVTTAQP